MLPRTAAGQARKARPEGVRRAPRNKNETIAAELARYTGAAPSPGHPGNSGWVHMVSSLVWKLASPYDAYISHVAELNHAIERIRYFSEVALRYEAGLQGSVRLVPGAQDGGRGAGEDGDVAQAALAHAVAQDVDLVEGGVPVDQDLDAAGGDEAHQEDVAGARQPPREALAPRLRLGAARHRRLLY